MLKWENNMHLRKLLATTLIMGLATPAFAEIKVG